MIQRGLSFLFVILLAFGCNRSSSPHYARVLLNEIVPDNGRFGRLTAAGEEVTPDYEGETITPDWIELYNPRDASVDLSGYYLSDNEESLRKWRFPQGVSIEGFTLHHEEWIPADIPLRSCQLKANTVGPIVGSVGACIIIVTIQITVEEIGTQDWSVVIGARFINTVIIVVRKNRIDD